MFHRRPENRMRSALRESSPESQFFPRPAATFETELKLTADADRLWVVEYPDHGNQYQRENQENQRYRHGGHRQV
jgi:hypothetical protein